MRKSFIKKPKIPSGRELFERCKRLETKYGDASEIVYAKPIDANSRYMVVVYTSCDQQGGAYATKKKGSDAIRIAGIYINNEGKTKGVIKNARVNRVGEAENVSKRMMLRVAKTAYALKENNIEVCLDCGAPKFTSRKGNLVCSEICWSK